MNFYLATKRHFKNSKNKFDIAINIFNKSSKDLSPVYKTGFHKWTDSMNCTTYSLVIYCFRIMIYKYGDCYGECAN